MKRAGNIEPAPVAQSSGLVPDYCEYEAGEDDPVYEVNRAFYLKVRQGPLVVVPAGSFVRLRTETAHELFFSGRIVPMGMKDGDLFEVISPICIVDQDGFYQTLPPGTRVRLTAAEAIEYLRQQNIKGVFQEENV